MCDVVVVWGCPETLQWCEVCDVWCSSRLWT